MSQGLPRQTVPILLKGLDQAQPRQVAVWGTLSLLSNLAIEKVGDGYEFFPRPGSAALSKTADAGTISAGMRLGTLGTALVLLTGVACYRKATDQWHRVATQVPVMGVDTSAITSNTLVTRHTNTAYVSGYTVRAVSALDATGGNYSIKASVIDSTGATVLDTILETGTFGAPRIIVSGTVAVVFWGQSPNVIRAAKFDSASPAAFGAAVNVVTAGTAASFDCQLIGATGTIGVFYADGVGVSQLAFNPTTMTPGAPVAYGFTAPDVFGYLTNTYSSSVIYVGHVDGVNGLRVTTFNGSTLALTATTVYDAASTQASNIAGYRDGAAVSVYFTTGTGQVYDRTIKVSTGAAATVVARSRDLSSKVLALGTTLFAMVRYRGTGQGTYFLLDLTNGVEVAKALPDIAFTGVSELPNLTAITSTLWLTSGIRTTAVTTTNGNVFTYTAASQILITHQDATVGKPVELNGGLHFPGAMPYLYDGVTMTEEGFPIAPEQSDTPTLSAGGSLTPSSTYTYRWVFEWLDGAGNLHRSSPNVLAQQVVLGASDTRVTFSLPTLRMTRKVAVSIAGYRTLANGDGSVYYKVTSSTSPTVNDPTADRVTFIDTMSDATAAAGEPLYTGGGVLENIAPPPCRVFAVHKGRLLAGGVDADSKAVWFSKDVIPGFGVAFSDFLVSRLSSTEAVKTVGTQDAFAVACTATGTWASSDEYPDDLGNGGVLRFQQYSTVTGCTTVGLSGRNDQGTIIYAGAAKGVWRMSRGLQFEYIGSNVENDVAAMTPTAVLTVPSRNETRVIGGTRVLVYESVHGQWARWDYAQTPGGAGFVDATMWNGTACYLCSDGTVIQESVGDYDDGGVHVVHRATFSGLNPAGVAGFARLYLTQITGRLLGSNDSADFVLRAEQSFDAVAIATKALTYAAGETELNFEVDPGTMGKCSRYDLSVYDSATSPQTAFSIAAATVLMGVKRGLNKLPPARRAT